MAGQTYEFPRGVDAPSIRPSQKPNLLTPETPVLIVFRGGPPIVEMWDQLDYIIPPIPEDANGVKAYTIAEWKDRFHPPGTFTLELGIARHLQSRAIVPGTRNPANYRRAESQLGIPGPNLDPPFKCEPFTAQQLERFGGEWRRGLAEGIDRTQMLGTERNAVRIGTQEVVDDALARGRSIEGDLSRGELPEDADERAARLAENRVVGGEGLRSVQQAEGLAQAAGEKVSTTTPGVNLNDPASERNAGPGHPGHQGGGRGRGGNRS